jgi:hypothetical protein
MLNLGQLRGMFYAYLGTPDSDPMYPPTTANALINAVARKYHNDIQQANPDFFAVTTTLIADVGTRDYQLPDDFAGWLDVRFTNSQGYALEETRFDELPSAWGFAAFAITGTDDAAVLHTSNYCTVAVPLYFAYTQSAADLAGDSDVPSWMPQDFHDLLAREAAIDAYGLGAESAPSPVFMQETMDRRAMFWLKVGKRGARSRQTRSL